MSTRTGVHRSRRPAQHAAPQRKRLWPRIVGFGVGGVFLLGIIALGVFVYQAISVASNLLAAKDEISLVLDDATSGDTQQVVEHAEKIQDMVEDANGKVSGPLWSIASAVPLVGENVNAVRLATQATHTIVEGALPPGIAILNSLDLKDASISDGGLDLSPLRDAQSSLPDISDAFDSANETVSSIDRDKLLPVVDDAVSSLTDVFEIAAPALDLAEQYLPNMLDLAGAEEPRRYMLVFQNNAEIRSGGGLPAATAIVDVDNGKAELADQTSTYSFRRDLKVIDPPDEMEQLYVSDTFTGFGNFTRTPNFPTTAEAFDSLWNITTDEHLDGVITIDPVVLSYMLKATGPVTSTDGTVLTSENAVQGLLYDAYQRYTGEQQDLFFGDVAARVFDKVADGDWDPVQMIDQLVRAAEEERLHAWFPREDEQAMVEDLEIDGALPTSNDEATEVGLFLNDYAASKLTYFLESSLSLTCDVAAGTMTTSITVANDVPVDGMTSYQLGIRNKRYSIPLDWFVLDVMYFAPPGSEILSVSPDPDVSWETRTGVERERNVWSNRFFVPTGETKTMSYTSTIPAGDLGPASLRFSPTVTDTPVTIDDSCGSVFAEASAAE
ncbi:DUF4012 domain-containing protein [Microbacterium sp. JB110]|uniref:DUF4012 domain-containing protein n=1 Tax=Microbacterium sp. JB110 TaxID=2024477 RepID=UPI00111ED71D|nr:DUF4012 domain-containing protein [Microbacterium sp. JB110]